MASLQPTGREQKLPEVPLRWSDFVWSLEKLRNKPYSKSTTERDWFRINPLEMVLLGCQTLCTRMPAQRNHGTMVLVMECLEKPMCLRPRYWYRLLAVLVRTCQADIPPLILQRCLSTLIPFWKSFQNVPEVQPTLYSWAVHDMSIITFLEGLIQDKECALTLQLMTEVKSLLLEIQETITAAKDIPRQIQSGAMNDAFIDRHVIPLLQSTLPECMTTNFLSLQLFILQKYGLNDPIPVSTQCLKQLAETLKTVSSDLPSCISNAINILLLLNVRKGELPETKELSEVPSSDSELEMTEEDVDGHHCTPDGLMAAFITAVSTWDNLAPNRTHQDHQGHSSSGDVASKVLSLAHVMLSSGPLHETLPTTTDFFTNTISTLMIYSTEGYLSNSPCEFFLEVMEYVSSLVEQGVPPTTVIQTNLPNLFGPIFGTRNHTVSCKLLEYGYLAACSQHQKSLLSEGLTYLINVFHLFPPIDKARIEMAARLKKIETMEIVHSIVDDLLNSVLQVTDEHDKSGPANRDDSTETEEDVVTTVLEEGGEDVSTQLVPVSDAERETDKECRLQILLHLLELACSMIRNGDNVSFLFANVLPNLFTSSTSHSLTANFNKRKLRRFFGEDLPTPLSSIPWQVDKKRFAVRLLGLATLSLKQDMSSPFQICGVVAPKLVQNLNTVQFSDEVKMALTMEILNATHEALENGHNITDLISHGIDLLTTLLPQSVSAEELRQFIGQMVRQLVATSHTSLLFLLKQSCHFMMEHFTEERVAIQGLFKTLIFRGKRDEIRSVFRLCRKELCLDKYTAVRPSLYSYSSGGINHHQLLALSDILVALMDVGKPHELGRTPSGDTGYEGGEEEEEERGRRNEETAVVMGRLTELCLERLTTCLTHGRFVKQEWESMSTELSRVALFRTLFSDEFSNFVNLSAPELVLMFESKFPPDVLGDEHIMQLLALCGSRIEHMQVPRYHSLKLFLCRLVQHFLTLNVHSSEPVEPGELQKPQSESSSDPTVSGSETVLEVRVQGLESYLLNNFSRNSSDRKKLTECGYSSLLWEKKLSVVVVTDGSHSLEENMRQTLLACYTEFADILRQMAVTHVPVDGEMVKSSELFSDELSLTELKGRRAVAVRVIDEKLGRVKEGHFHEKKISLLAKEDKIEEDFEKQAMAPVKPKTFSVALNTTFFDCARCCGAHIIGCYAPTGEHCERSLEIGIRCDSAIASIYNEAGLEIENVEILFTPEGAYMFKAYSNGHPYDTSQVWVSLLTALLAEPSSLVPAVIIPNSYPNQRAWDTIRRGVSTELTGGILTCQHDFSPEWRTYYDHRPEKVRMGVDVVLYPGFSLSATNAEHSQPPLRRQRSRMAKDLAGMIFDHVMQDLLQDDWWKHFRFLGKCISQYLSEAVENGELRPSVIDEGLDYERWRKNFSRLKNAPVIPPQLVSGGQPSQSGSLPSKEQLVAELVHRIDKSLNEWSTHTFSNLTDLCTYNHRQFLELKGFVEKSKGALLHFKDKLLNIHECLKRCTFIVPLLSLPDSAQEEIIHWIFRNEDRVWRYRGGRDGRETLQQFMSFLGRDFEGKSVEKEGVGREGGVRRNDENVFAGVVAFCVPSALEDGRLENITDEFQVVRMVGYAVGEIAKPSSPDQSAEVEDGEEEEEEEEEEEPGRWQPGRGRASCYEVVTAWVHPSYRGLNLGVQMYLEIAKQVPTQLVLCDMLEGSVERIIRSNSLLRWLQRLHILSFVIRRRQRSYAVVTPTGTSEQFEQVVFSVWPVRAAITLHNLSHRVRGHIAPTVATTLPALTLLTLVACRRWIL